MNQYLESIGFNLTSRKELNIILDNIKQEFSHQTIVSYKENINYCELQKKYGQNIGIAICGELENNHFDPLYYFPYVVGSGVSTYAELIVERRYEREQYIGICEDSNVGISIIFMVQNGIEYIKESQAGAISGKEVSITFSGLALNGKVLFPVQKDESLLRDEKAAQANRKMLIDAARSGDQVAIESLTLDDINTYSKVSRRLVSEDIFTIVDTYFMPYGVECDLYAILGEIISVRKQQNTVTGVWLYQMKLNVNGLEFDICVPVDAVMGEPTVGRRFKGNIWLQGYINF